MRHVYFIFITLFFAMILSGICFASDSNLSIVSNKVGDQVNPVVTGNNVAWSEYDPSSQGWNTFLKNMKTKKVLKITDNKPALEVYYSPRKTEYGNFRTVVEKSGNRFNNYQLTVYNNSNNHPKIMRYFQSKPREIAFFGKYIVYSMEIYTKSSDRQFIGMNLHLMNIVSKKDQIIYDAKYRIINPTIYGNDIYWLEGSGIKSYNIKTKKNKCPFKGKKAIISPNIKYKLNLAHFSVYENFLAFESSSVNGSNIYLMKMADVGSGVPHAVINFDKLLPNQTVTFNGSSSFDHDGKIISYFWDFGDGSSATSPQTSHIYTAGYKYIKLTVTDNDTFLRTLTKKLEVFCPGKDIICNNLSVKKIKNYIVISSTLQNQGNKKSGIFKVYYFLSSKQNLSGTKYYLTNKTMPSLGPAVSYTKEFVIKASSSIPTGDYYLIASADATKLVKEFNEKNNILSTENKITVQKYYLNLGENYLQAQLIIPKLGVKAFIRSDTVNAYGAVYHYPNSVMPGKPGECGFLAHRTTYSALFKNIANLRYGDLVTVKDYSTQKNYYYKVTSNNKDIRWEYETHPMTFKMYGPSKLLLVTCYPPGRKEAEAVTHCALFSIAHFK